MARSVAIIGAGQIGFGSALAFREAGWDVRVLARSEPEWTGGDIAFERYTAGEDAAPGADVVLDTIAFDEDDIARYDPQRVGRLIAVSSASVYVDYTGRTLDEAAQNGFPDLPDPISEEQMTVRPGPETYSTRKVRMEQAAQRAFGPRATILRPCAIHGPYSRHPREWWFVNRIKDRRRTIPLAFDGNSVFHTTSARSLGRLAAFLAVNELGGVWNAADDDAPSVREIGQAIAAHFGKRIRFYGMDGAPQGSVGRTPWSIPKPFMVDTGKAIEAGFEGFGQYADGIGSTIDWLRSVRSDDWRTAFPQLAAYPWDMFDYTAEDRFFDERH
ncbi:MAG: hypothetical protein WBA51_06295 [Erythrobacter sp.]